MSKKKTNNLGAPEWSAAERDILARHGPATASEMVGILAAAGFRRTSSAIKTARRKLDMPRPGQLGDGPKIYVEPTPARLIEMDRAHQMHLLHGLQELRAAA